MRFQNTTTRVIGLLAFAVAVVGYVFFGWRFGDGTSNPIGIAFAIVAVLVGVAVTLRGRS